MNNDINEFEKRIGCSFHDPSLLKCALTHSSYANECSKRIPNNERLEFLGDAVLELVSSTCLFERFPDRPEGWLSATRASIVCESTLDLCARRIGLQDYIFLGKGEETTGGRSRPSIVSDAMEALIGAIYIDRGMEEASAFIHRYILDAIESKELYHDTKSKLQEYTQKKKLGLPEYRITQNQVSTNEPTFYAEVFIDGESVAKASGRSKKAAQKNAAQMALKALKVE